MKGVRDEDIRDTLLAMTAAEKSVAPREVAASLTPDGADWRKLLPRIKAEAIKLEGEERLVFVRKKKVVPSAGLKGVYRFSAAGAKADTGAVPEEGQA